MKPPLGAAADCEALIAGIADGAVDVVATDHAPHHEDEKNVAFQSAPFGIVGLETAVALVLDRLVAPGRIPLSRAVELLALRPHRILGIPGGDLRPGSPADITLIDLDAEMTVAPESFRTLGRSTPFAGARLRGGVGGPRSSAAGGSFRAERAGRDASAARVEARGGAGLPPPGGKSRFDPTRFSFPAVFRIRRIRRRRRCSRRGSPTATPGRSAPRWSGCSPGPGPARPGSAKRWRGKAETAPQAISPGFATVGHAAETWCASR